jgi:serine/threonine protein kinase
MGNLSVHNFKTALTRSQQLPFTKLNSRDFRLVYNEKNEPVRFFGRNSVVFKITDGTRFFALKCYTTELFNRWEYLSNVQSMLRSLQKDWIVPFEIYENELQVENDEQQVQLATIVLLPWIEGERLSDLVRLYCSRQSLNVNLESLRKSFIALAKKHLGHLFSHGDITPENIIVTPSGEMMLIDQDSFTFEGWNSSSGQSGWSFPYQHPYRNPRKPDLHADDFSFLIIALSLKALERNPGLFQQFNSSRGLLFTIDDYKYPDQSKLIKEIEKTEDLYLLDLLSLFHAQLNKKSIAIPDLLKYLDISKKEQTSPVAEWSTTASNKVQEDWNSDFYSQEHQAIPSVINARELNKEVSFQKEEFYTEELSPEEPAKAELEKQNILKEVHRKQLLLNIELQKEELRKAEAEKDRLQKEAHQLEEQRLIEQQMLEPVMIEQQTTVTEAMESTEEELIPVYRQQRKKIRLGVVAVLSSVLIIIFGIKVFFPETKFVKPVNYKELVSGKENKNTDALAGSENAVPANNADKSNEAINIALPGSVAAEPAQDEKINSKAATVSLPLPVIQKSVAKSILKDNNDNKTTTKVTGNKKKRTVNARTDKSSVVTFRKIVF